MQSCSQCAVSVLFPLGLRFPELTLQTSWESGLEPCGWPGPGAVGWECNGIVILQHTFKSHLGLTSRTSGGFVLCLKTHVFNFSEIEGPNCLPSFMGQKAQGYKQILYFKKYCLRKLTEHDLSWQIYLFKFKFCTLKVSTFWCILNRVVTLSIVTGRNDHFLSFD